MDKAYDHKKVEERIYRFWEDKGYFQPEINDKGKPYSIILPPPNANAPLHFGHAMYVIEDILIRYHRMKGYKTLWLPGADHAGFETQFVFEQKLKKEGKSRFDYDRETLYKMILDYVSQNRPIMEGQLRRLGFSLDWSRSKFTLDPDVIKIVYGTFKKLYDDGLTYRAERLVNYCTFDGTSFSDLEVLHVEKESTLYFVKYKLKDGGFIEIATTRPETILADVAVAVNPKDKRYKESKRTTIVPMVNREVPIIEDPAVDMKFGTGALKITPGHDQNDFDIAQRHGIKGISIIGFDGKLKKEAGKYQGLYPKQAREKIVENLKKDNLITKEEKIIHQAPVCYKCKNTIEPLLMEQWFIKMKPLAKPAIDTVKKGKIKIIPKRFEKILVDFLENIRDWNISRQIVWGIRIPAWENKKTREWVVTEGESPGENFEQDTDTFDTWFSSAQWPFATLMSSYGLPRMGFHEDVIPQVLKGKTKTYRLRDHGFKIGDKVLFENTQAQKLFGYGVITEVEETTVEKIDYKDKTHYKTYESLNELVEAFKLRNPDKTVTPKSKAYLYAYEFHQLEDLPSDFQKFYPTTVMETGYDILRWWVARMIMIGIYVTNKVPFENVVLHGLVKDPLGKKMSKSKGNVVDPLELVDQYGADSVRFALIYGTALGNDQSLSYTKLEGGRRFANKLWNVARYIDLSVKNKKVGYFGSRVGSFSLKDNPSPEELWCYHVFTESTKLFKKITDSLEKYRFHSAAEDLYEFIWHTFADVYIEESKPFLRTENKYTPYVRGTLLDIVDWSLRLLHPFMPFITEDLYSRLQHKHKSEALIVAPWPS